MKKEDRIPFFPLLILVLFLTGISTPLFSQQDEREPPSGSSTEVIEKKVREEAEEKIKRLVKRLQNA